MPRTAFDPSPGDVVVGTMPDGRECRRYVTRTEMGGFAIYYATEPGGPEARDASTWITSWRNWCRKRKAKLED